MFAAADGAVHAQAYPARPLKMVAVFPAGGTSDVIARLMAQYLETALGKPVVVENRVGSNGVIGTDYVAKSPADGYTLLLAPSGHAINNSLNPNVPYDPVRDFTCITLVGTVPMVVTAALQLPASNLGELIELAKMNPGQLNFGSGGPGSSNQLATELFASLAGIRMTHIPYKGDTPGITDLLGGHIGFIFLNMPAALPLVSAGRLKALAITSEQRSPLLPDVPAIAETLPGYAAGSWHGIYAPAGTPREIILRLNAELVKILRRPDVTAKLAAMGVNAVGDTPAEFAAFTKAEIVKWAEVIKDANIKL
jgi:tripartite-type tricarboxylate transporter receptor subunit TctC